MKCVYCGKVFTKEESLKGCKGCPMSKGCGKIKCPYCNYENYEDLKLEFLGNIKKWGKNLWRKK